ncbi:MAG: hypothetical protein AAF651_11055 [Cyanobacteria bacterium P01_C01_bin.73]
MAKLTGKRSLEPKPIPKAFHSSTIPYLSTISHLSTIRGESTTVIDIPVRWRDGSSSYHAADGSSPLA